MTPTKAVVLAQPQNLRSAGCAIRDHACLPPAALLPVANRPLLSHALCWLAEAGVREAAVVVPEDLAAEARRAAGDGHGVKSVSWLEQCSGETLARALGDLTGFTKGGPFIMHLADSLAKERLEAVIPNGTDSKADALLVVDEATQVGVADVVQLYTTGGAGHLTRRRLRHDSAGVAILSGLALADAVELDAPPEHILEALADRIEQRGGRVDTCSAAGWWRFRGGADAWLEGNRFALEAVRPDYRRARLEDATIQGAVIAHPDACIESSTVRGPAVIGARAHVRDAYLGPYTSVGEDVLIDGAEVEHSIILRGASITHLGGRIEASIVGANSRVFHDFRLPRALRLNLGEGAEVCLG